MNIITTTNSSTNWKPTNKKVDKLSDLNRHNTCLVHMTNYLPVNGEILSIRNAKKNINGVSPNRNTIHFSFNKTVSPTNIGQVWNNRSVGIIVPFDKILDETPKEDIIGGQMEDFYIKNRVKLPEGSVIVRKSDKVPSGTLKIINAEKIDEFKNTKGLTVIETSDNVSKVTDECIDMMGYTNINYKLSEDTDIPVKYFEMTPQERNTDFKMQTLAIKNSNKLFDSLSDLNQFWVNLSNENNLKTYKLHALSPYGRSDYLIDSVHILANTTNS